MDMQTVASDFHISVKHPIFQLALTAPRHEDGEASIAGLNDPAVFMKLNGPPYPYTAKDWDFWFNMVSGLWNENIAELQEIKDQDQSTVASQDWSKRKWLGRKMWHSTIRDMGNGGKFIGDITVPREPFMYILDEEERQRRKEENEKLDPGDPRIVWTIGFWLIPEYHGRGIMPAVLQTLMAEIILPYMNAHTVHGSFFEHNLPSRKGIREMRVRLPRYRARGRSNQPSEVEELGGQEVGEWTHEVATQVTELKSKCGVFEVESL